MEERKSIEDVYHALLKTITDNKTLSTKDESFFKDVKRTLSLFTPKGKRLFVGAIICLVCSPVLSIITTVWGCSWVIRYLVSVAPYIPVLVIIARLHFAKKNYNEKIFDFSSKKRNEQKTAKQHSAYLETIKKVLRTQKAYNLNDIPVLIQYCEREKLSKKPFYESLFFQNYFVAGSVGILTAFLSEKQGPIIALSFWISIFFFVWGLCRPIYQFSKEIFAIVHDKHTRLIRDLNDILWQLSAKPKVTRIKLIRKPPVVTTTYPHIPT